MAHGIEIRDGQASMMYVGDVPWHGLGVRLDRPATAFEALRAARLDWVVDKKPLFPDEGAPRGVPKRYVIVRRDLVGSGSFPLLGIVSKGYRPLFLDPIVGEGAAAYHTAGALGNGERVWILAKLPVPMRVEQRPDQVHAGSRRLSEHADARAVGRPGPARPPHAEPDAEPGGPALCARDHRRGLPRARGVLRRDDAGADEPGVAGRLPDAGLPGRPADGKAARRVARDRAWSEYFFDQGKGADLPGVRGTLTTRCPRSGRGRGHGRSRGEGHTPC